MIDEALIAKVANYKPSLEKLRSFSDTPMLLTVGISGAGKDTLTGKLLQEYPKTYQRFVSHTTRAPRENHGKMEQEGHEYHFIDFAAANRMLDAQEFIEANVYSQNVYGTSLAEVQRAHDAGKILINDVDVNGVSHIVSLLPGSKPVFILPPSYEVWKQRFMKRYTGEVDVADWQRRIRTAKAEIENALANDYFYLVVNDDIDRAVGDINSIAHGDVKDRRPEKALAAARDILAGLEKQITNS